MGRAIDLFVTYRFIKLLTTPFEKTDAFKLGIINEKGLRQVVPGTTKPTPLSTIKERNAYKRLLKYNLTGKICSVTSDIHTHGWIIKQ